MKLAVACLLVTVMIVYPAYQQFQIQEKGQYAVPTTSSQIGVGQTAPKPVFTSEGRSNVFQTSKIKYGKGLIPSSAMGALFIKPLQIFSSPEMNLLPREVISVIGTKEFGIDPVAIENAMFLVDSPQDFRQPPGFALMLTFRERHEPSEKLLKGYKKESLLGRDLFRRGVNDPILFQYDEHTIIFGIESFVKKMLYASDAQSQLIQLIEERGVDSHVSAFVAVEPIRSTIVENLPSENRLPPLMQGLLELPELIEAVVVNKSFKKGAPTSIEIVALDVQKAGRIQDIYKESFAAARQFAESYLSNEMRDQDEVFQEAVQQYAQRVGVYLEMTIRPERRDRSIVFQRIGNNAQLSNVATIGTLVGLLLPAVQQVREAARRTQSMNNLRQIALATLNYESVYRKFPSNIVDEEGKPLLSWRVAILPFIDQNDLYEQFRLDEPWDSEHNSALMKRMPEVFRSPNVALNDRTVYQGLNGPGTIFEKQGLGFGQITDGTSNTMLAVEGNLESAVEWTKPEDIPFAPDQEVTAVGNLRPGGFLTVLCDGSVHFVSKSTELETIKNLIQRNDGNIIQSGAF